jgi:hypothetical protein
LFSGALSFLFVYFVHFTANNQFVSTKYQLNSNMQHAAQAPARDQTEFRILNFGYCDLFVIWNLLFVFSGLSGLDVAFDIVNNSGG